MNNAISNKISFDIIRKEKYYGVISAIVTMGILLLAMSYGQMLGGKYVFLSGDLYEQIVPFTYLFFAKIKNWSNLLYSFAMGPGMNTSLAFAFDVFSPFNILYLFANEENINVISIAIFVLKAGMAAYSFQLFSKYNLKVKSFISVIFSVGYALVSYGIASSCMTALYDGIYLLPLILVAINYMVDNNKSMRLIVLYTVLFVSNFYSGYIVGLASFVYFVIYITSVRGIYKKNIRVVGKYIISVGCSVLISSFILVPALYEALKQGVVEKTYRFSSVPVWDIVSSFFPFSEFEMYAPSPYCYCGIPAILLLGAFFTNRHINRKYKIIGGGALVFAGLSMTVKPIYAAAHMFNDPTGYTFRYAYIVSLVVCSMGLMAFRHIDGIDKKKTLVIDGLLVLVYCISPVISKISGLNNKNVNLLFYLVALGLIIIWIVLFFYYTKNSDMDAMNSSLDSMANISKIAAIRRNTAIVALIVISFETGLNSYMLLSSQPRFGIDEYNYRVSQANLLSDELKRVDESVYRIHYDGQVNANQACLYDYLGSTLYSSSFNPQLKDFLYSIGVSCTDFYIFGNGNTDLSRLLLDEKYNLGAHVYYREGNENYIEENYTAGFGYMIPDSDVDIEFGPNVFENQNKVYSCLAGEEVSPFIIYGSDVLVDGANINIDIDEEGIVTFALTEDAANGYLQLAAPVVEGLQMYSWLSAGYNDVYSSSPIINSPDVKEEGDSINHILMAPHIVKMSEDEGMYNVYIWLVEGTVRSSSIKEYYYAYYDESCVNEIIDKLADSSLDITRFEDGLVCGRITASEPGVCFISVPYEEGWTAIVDGEICEIKPLFNNSFIGVPLEAGYHEIELRFEAPYSRVGIALSCIGVLILCIIVLVECRRKHDNQQKR